MSDSGKGSSFSGDWQFCQRYFYWARKQRLRSKIVQPPLVVGEGCHAYIEAIFISFGLVPKIDDALELALSKFEGLVRPYAEDEKVQERAELARIVLPVWAIGQWGKLERGEEKTLAVELPLSWMLPKDTDYGPIHPELREITCRIDRVFTDAGGLSAVDQDFKTTTKNSLKMALLDYVQTDQHLQNAWLWNKNEGYLRHKGIAWVPCERIVYSGIRLHRRLNEHTFYDEERVLSEPLMADWYQRELLVRAHISAVWEKGKEHYEENTKGCHSWGHPCPFLDLCKQPGSEQEFIGEKDEPGCLYYREEEETASAS